MLVHKSRIFDLYCTNVNSRRPPFEYIGHHGSCAALLIDERDEIGLVAHHFPAIGHTLFELPSQVLTAERSIEDVLTQHLREEVGLAVGEKQLQRLTSLYASPGYSSELLTLFLVRLNSSQRAGADTLRWFSITELNRLIQQQELVDMKTVAAITAYQAVLWKGLGDEVL